MRERGTLDWATEIESASEGDLHGAVSVILNRLDLDLASAHRCEAQSCFAG